MSGSVRRPPPQPNPALAHDPEFVGECLETLREQVEEGALGFIVFTIKPPRSEGMLFGVNKYTIFVDDAHKDMHDTLQEFATNVLDQLAERMVTN